LENAYENVNRNKSIAELNMIRKGARNETDITELKNQIYRVFDILSEMGVLKNPPLDYDLKNYNQEDDSLQ
jgi:hypothetical protein